MRISDWSSDVCSSDLQHHDRQFAELDAHNPRIPWRYPKSDIDRRSCESDISCSPGSVRKWQTPYWDCRSCTRSDHSPSHNREFYPRSEEHTSELQSLMRISYAVFCLKKKHNTNKN